MGSDRTFVGIGTVLKVMLVVVACSALLCCGGGSSGGGVGGGTGGAVPPPAERVYADAPLLTQVNGQVLLVPGYVTDRLARLASMADTVSVSASGAFSGLKAPLGDLGYIVLLQDAQGTVLAPAYYEPGVPISESSIALGLVLLTSRGMVIPPAKRSDFLAEVGRLVSFSDLVVFVQTSLTESRVFLDPTTHPDIFEGAQRCAVEAWEFFDSGLSPKPGLAGTALRLGPSDGPHLDDGLGRIQTVNPKLVFYSLGLEGTTEHRYLLHPREGLVKLRWGIPPVARIPNVRQDIAPPDGSYVGTFYKGWNFDQPGWWDPFQAPGLATWANTLYTVGLVLDVVLRFAGSSLDAFNVLKNPDFIQAALGFTGVEGSTLDSLLAAMKQLTIDGSKELFGQLIEWLGENWDRVALWLWEQWPGLGTADFLRGLGDVVGFLSGAKPIIDAITLGWDIGNTYIPFASDVVRAPPTFKVCFTVSGSALTSTCAASQAPEALFTWAPTLPRPGSVVAFDASASRDDSTALQYRWDFDGDGTWDTSYSSSPTTSHQYDDGGTYAVTLGVRDPDGDSSLLARQLFVLPCNEQQFAGGDTPETHVVQLGLNNGTFRFDYETYSQEDRIQIRYEGQTVFDSGCLGTGGTRTTYVSYSGSSTSVTVEVIPNCFGGSGTAWNFTVYCPE